MAYSRPDVPSNCTWHVDADFSTSPHTSLPYSSDKTEQILPNILHAVGNTPMVKLNRIPASIGLQCEILAKCEFLNPGGSVKDRIAVRMIEDAEKTGLIKPGGTLIEVTAGNTGIGLAMVAAVKGYRCKILMSTKYSSKKSQLLRALGAEVVDVPAETNIIGTPQSQFTLSDKFQRETPNSMVVGQFTNESNPLTHYDQTALEIYKQCNGKLDMLVLGAGTGGTITGIGRKLRKLCPNCTIVGADVTGSVFSRSEKSEENDAESLVEGIGYPFVPKIADTSIVDFWIKVTDEEVFTMARRLHKEEGLLCGGSSGAALVAAVKASANLNRNQRCIVMFPDGIYNYTNKFTADPWLEARCLKPCINTYNHWWWDEEIEVLNLKASIMVPEDISCSDALQIMDKNSTEYCPAVSSLRCVVGMVTVPRIMELLMSRKIGQDSLISRAATKDFRVLNLNSKLGLASRILEIEPFLLVVNKTQGNGDVAKSSISAHNICGVITRLDLLRFVTSSGSCNGNQL